MIDTRGERIAELESALAAIRERASLWKTAIGGKGSCLEWIEREATMALAGVDTYEQENG